MSEENRMNEMVYKINAGILRNMTDKEVAHFFSTAADPIIRELSDRLETLAFDYEDTIQRIKEVCDKAEATYKSKYPNSTEITTKVPVENIINIMEG